MNHYTKGEWTLFEHGITSQIMCGKYKVAEGIYNKANARLIAASPRMYEAGMQLLEVMCELCRRLNPQHATCQSCEEIEGYRKVFAKVEGE